MMSLLLATIRSNAWATLLATLLLVGGGYAYWLRCEVSGLELRLEDAKVKALSLERSNVSLLAALKQQNAAVAELARKSAQKKAQTASLRAEARRKAHMFEAAAQNIMAFEPAGATQCEQISSLMERFQQKLYDGN